MSRFDEEDEDFDAIVVFRNCGEEDVLLPRGVSAAKGVRVREKDKLIAVRGLDWRLEELADALDWPAPLDPVAVSDAAKDPPDGIKPLFLDNFEDLHGKFESDLKVLYRPFDKVLRLKLLRELLRGEEAFPLHQENRLLELWNDVFAPLDQVREYFGERIALYFGFLVHVTQWCRISALGGALFALCFFYEVSVEDRSRKRSRALPLFPIFQMIWAVSMLEMWKRRESRLALKWGTLGLGDKLPDRPDFKGKKRRSPIDGKWETYFDPNVRHRLQMQSCLVIFLLIALVVGASACVVWLRIFLQRSYDADLAAAVAACVNSAQIEFMNYVFAFVARSLTKRENYRTEPEYMDALASKLVLFYLCNYNFPLFYYAFFQRIVEGCPRRGRDQQRDKGTCYGQLELNLFVIFATKTIGNVFNELVKPWIATNLRKRRMRQKERRPAAAAAEKQFLLQDADGISDYIEDMTVLAVRFSFLLFFVVACPLLPAIAWAANHLEARNDLRKFLFVKRREWPSGAWTIGSWLTVHQLVVYASVFTNTFALFYTVEWSPFDYPLSKAHRVFITFISQYAIFACLLALNLAVPDLPHDVSIHLKRQSFVCSKLIERLPDEDEEEDCHFDNLCDLINDHAR